MIRSFKGQMTALVAKGQIAKGFPANVVRSAQRKLKMLDEAGEIADLLSPPGNRLEALKGDRKGQYSIRINDQWRTCFVWTEDGPRDVEIVDYHV
ncbi:type II toxin-antitoxin system RelE/ParE family toxin [Rhizobium alvei]|uniref:Type II toxin-antitoxin system RelE/ParE family toxin n=1 Tax=Rhizobium alvei TaxID=1132659 RepID=A0ABT8YMH5_9HYPH|nr:type II toxin-antitoxin system RelE/ParE family toxin [Rhizobium alvei]MDO6964940.1 type II toxin-antitoxin system RelE/ParE family toxin [Rhizobium alvei]